MAKKKRKVKSQAIRDTRSLRDIEHGNAVSRQGGKKKVVKDWRKHTGS